jgi:glucokinase
MAESTLTRLALALDVGGTRLRAAAIDAEGKIHHRESAATQPDGTGKIIVGQLIEIANKVLERCDDVAGVGLSALGPLDLKSGVITTPATLPNFRDVPIRAMLEDVLQRDVLVENDAISAACGEWKYGAGRGVESLVYITVSTGIGGGVICNGHVLRGASGFAGHIGHMKIFPDGERCGCGNPGCWEVYASGTAFTARAQEKLGPVTAEEVFLRAAKGDALAQQLVDQEADYLGIGIVSLLHLFNPERVVIGGGLSNALEQLRPGIARRVENDAMPPFRVEICKAELGDNSGLLGVAQLVFLNA